MHIIVTKMARQLLKTMIYALNELYHEFAVGIKWEHLEKICTILNCNPLKTHKI